MSAYKKNERLLKTGDITVDLLPSLGVEKDVLSIISGETELVIEIPVGFTLKDLGIKFTGDWPHDRRFNNSYTELKSLQEK